MNLKGVLVLCNKIHTHHQYVLNKVGDSYKWEFAASSFYPRYLKDGDLYYLIIRRHTKNIKSIEFIEKDLNKFVIIDKYLDLDHPTLKNKKMVWWW